MIHFQTRATLRKLAHLIALAACAGAACATGLGPVQLHSGLGQQLRASIPLLAFNASDIDPSCIKATVESADGAYLTTPQIGVVSKGAPPAITLASKQAMMEPALTLRVKLSCGTSINRDYQILLDPPQYDIATNGERQPVASVKAEALPESGEPAAAASTDVAPPAATPTPARRSPPSIRAPKPRKPVTIAPKVAAAPTNPVQPPRSVLKVTTAEAPATPIMKQAPASPTSPPGKNATPATASAGSVAPPSGSPVQPDLQLYALQAQMKDQMQALQKEMAAMRQQNQLDKTKLEELRKSSVTPQVTQGLIGLLLLCLGAIGWLGWRVYSLKNNHHLE